MAKHKLSLWSWILGCLLLTWGNQVFCPKWQTEGMQSCIAFDVEGYYWYLPSLFIYHNLTSQDFSPEQFSELQSSGRDYFDNGFQHPESKRYVLKYTCGMAVLYSPAFFAGHLAAGYLGIEQNGFTAPYKLALNIWGILFAFIGLYYLRKLLLYYYSDKVVALVLFLLVFASNYFNYAAIDVCLSHSWLFTLNVGILLLSRNFYTQPKLKYLIGLGFLIGLATLIRPTEIILVLLPLLWGVDSFTELKARFRFLKTQYKGLLIAVLCALLPISLQLLYWKGVSGHWIVYSYGDQSFSWTHPHIADYLWSYRAGWLRYTPLFILAFIGLLPFIRKGPNRLMAIIYLFFYLYIVTAWDIWDYGGFSGRAMVQAYPVLVFPLASLLTYAFRHKKVWFLLAPALTLSLYLNIWWHYHAHGGTLIDPFSTNKAYYWKVIGRWAPLPEYEKLKDTEELYEGPEPALHLIYEGSKEADTSFCCSKEQEHSQSIQVQAISSTAYQWLRVKADFYCEGKEWVWHMIPQLSIQFYDGDQLVKASQFRVHRLLNHKEEKSIFVDISTPKEKWDNIKVYLWNAGSNTRTCMRHTHIYLFNEAE